MSNTINIGSIEGQLKLIDLFTGPMKEISKKLDNITDVIERDFKRTDKAVDKLGNSFANLGKEVTGNLTKYFAATALVSGSIAAITSVTKQFTQANIEAEESQKKVTESVHRYGESSGVTVDQIDDLASSISRLSGIDDEAIANAEALALKYNRISSEILPRFTQAAVDMAAATGEDLPAAFEKQAKIINQPLKGLTLLSREGYAVSKSQSDLVKKLVSTNEILDAQNVLLGILESQYEGAAAAARDSMQGALIALGTTWENFLERVGQDNMGPLRSALESIITLLENATDAVDEFELGWHYFRASVYSTLAAISDFAAKSPFTRSEARKKWAEEAREAEAQAAASGFAIADILMGVRRGHEAAAGAALEQTEAESKLGQELNKLQNSINQSIEDLQRRADNARDLYLAALISTKAYNAEVLKQKVTAAILQEENKLRETGGKLTEKQRNAIAAAVISEDHFNKKLQETLKLYQSLLEVSLTVTDNIVKTGFDKDFKKQLDEIHEGVRLIQIDSEEMLNALDLKRSLELDLDFELRISEFNNLDPHLRQIEQNYLSFLERLGTGFEQSGETAIEAGERIFSKMAERFGWTIDDIKAKLSTLEDQQSIRDLESSGSSILGIYRSERNEINRLTEVAAKQNIDITEGTNKKLNDLQQNFWSENLSNWSGALDFLTEQFGGFFDYLNRAVQSLQQAQAFGQNISGIASGMGASSATAGAAGALGGTAAVFALIYEWGNELIKASNSRDYGAGTEFSINNFNEGTSQLNQSANQVVKAIRSIIEKIEDTLRISFEDLSEIGVKVRNDGEKFKAYFKGELIGKFNSLEEALSETLLLAFSDPSTTLHGLSDLMNQALKEFTTPDFEELLDTLEKMREISDLELGGAGSQAVQIIESIRHLDDLWKALGNLREITPSVTEGFENLIAAEIRSWQAWADSITGREKTSQELLAEKKQEAVIFEAQKKFRIAELEMKKLSLEADLEWLKGKGGLLEGEGKLRKNDLEISKGFLVAEATLMQAELSLNEQWILAMQAQIDAISVLIQSLLDIPEIDLDKIKIPKSGKGNKDGLKDWIDDKKFDLDTRGLGEYEKAVLEKEREYQDKLAELGKKDKALRAELIALRERELALMEEERKAQVAEDVENFINQASSFEQVRKTASDLIKEIEDSPLGDEQKAGKIADVLEAVEKQIEKLSLESAASILGQMLNDLQEFGASEALQSDVRRNLAIIEHTLRIAQYRTEIEILRQQGKVSDAVLAAMDKSLAFLEGLDINDLFGNGEDDNGSTDSGDAYNDKRDKINQAEEEYLKKIKEATDLLAKYKDQGVDPLTKELKKIKDDFIKIKEALGNTPQIINEENEAIKRAYQDALSGIQEFYNSLLNGADSALTVSQRYEAAQKEYMRILNEVKSGDYSELEDLDDAAQEFISLVGQMFGTSTGGFQEIKQQVLEQLGKLLNLGNVNVGGSTGSSTSSNSNNIIQFPQQVIDNSRESITATNNVANVINIRSSRQEALLSQIVTELINIKRKLQEIDEDDDISYGD